MAKTNPPPGGGHSLHPGYLRRRGDPRRGGIEGGGVDRSCIGVASELHRSYIGVRPELDWSLQRHTINGSFPRYTSRFCSTHPAGTEVWRGIV